VSIGENKFKHIEENEFENIILTQKISPIEYMNRLAEYITQKPSLQLDIYEFLIDPYTSALNIKILTDNLQNSKKQILQEFAISTPEIESGRGAFVKPNGENFKAGLLKYKTSAKLGDATDDKVLDAFLLEAFNGENGVNADLTGFKTMMKYIVNIKKNPQSVNTSTINQKIATEIDGSSISSSLISSFVVNDTILKGPKNERMPAFKMWLAWVFQDTDWELAGLDMFDTTKDLVWGIISFMGEAGLRPKSLNSVPSISAGPIMGFLGDSFNLHSKPNVKSQIEYTQKKAFGIKVLMSLIKLMKIMWKLISNKC
jgi:hypothetical protein